MRVLIVGCGYVGLALGSRLVAAGHSVAGLRRPGSDPAPLRERGLEPLHADISKREDLERLPRGWDWVVDCVAPSDGGEEAYRFVYLEGARQLMAWLRPSPPVAFVFTGSTGVYPQNDGSAVDETGSTDAVSGTGRILRETEDVLLAAAADGFPAMLLRIAGIYGPGRNRIAAMARGESRLVGDGLRWMNMVHRDDLVEAIVAVLERGRPGRIYNVGDGAPCTEAEFYGWLANRMGRGVGPGPVRTLQEPEIPPGTMPGSTAGETPAATDGRFMGRSGEATKPDTAPAQPEGVVGASGAPVSTGRRVRGGTNKRVVVRRLREETGWIPRHPDYRSGYEEEIRSWERISSTPAGRGLPSGGGTDAGVGSGPAVRGPADGRS